MTRNLPILLDMLIKGIIAKLYKKIPHTKATNIGIYHEEVILCQNYTV